MTTKEWAEAIASGKLDREFSLLYGEAGRARRRHEALLSAYEGRFGSGEVLLLSAPGRTELAGNHTDHQQGMVLCGSVTQDTLAAVSQAENGEVNILSDGFGEIRLTLDELSPMETEKGTSAALVRGVAAALAQLGLPIGGFRAAVTSDVPPGGGLSSSASFEVLLGAVFTRLWGGRAVRPMTLAKAGQRAEREYFGKPSGLLDQAACAGGGISLIDFEDPAEPRVVPILFDFRQRGYVLCAVDTRTSHAGLTEDYAAIPRDMLAVAARFGKAALRYVNQSDFAARRSALAAELSPLALSRAEHFFREEERVSAMANALAAGDMDTYLREMNASGESSRLLLRNIIPPSQPQRNEMAIALARAESLLRGKGAWRIHGGGFAGCIQCLVPEGEYDSFRTGMDNWYGEGAVFELRIRPCGVHELSF